MNVTRFIAQALVVTLIAEMNARLDRLARLIPPKFRSKAGDIARDFPPRTLKAP
jgi:hypothetical protein